MNEPSGLAPEVVTIRDLHIRFNLGGRKNRRCFVRRRKKRCMRYAVSVSLSVRERRSASWASRGAENRQSPVRWPDSINLPPVK